MFPHRSSLVLASAVLALGTLGPARAETLAGRTQYAPATPTRGMTMTQVEKRYGAPARRLAPAGGDSRWHPTINRWVYADYTVYFERDRVIDSVVNRVSPEKTGPKTAPGR